MLPGNRPHGWWVPAACATLAAALVTASALVLTQAQGREQAGGAQPEAGAGGGASAPAAAPGAQPIDFSHARHVARAGIDCQFCHAYARRGPVAGVPSVERCVGCHRTILNEHPEIARVLDYWEREEPIPWIRVHDLPDYVRFSHKAHVRAGVDCATCHGDVAGMAVARQVESLSMGWCVDCHAEREASRDCLVCHY